MMLVDHLFLPLCGFISWSPEGYVLLRSPGPYLVRFPESLPLIGKVVGGSGLRWYGLLMAIAVLVGLFLSKYLAEQRHLEKEPGLAAERVERLAIWLVLAGFAGARLYYVVTHWSDFQDNPLAAFAIWQGGIIIHGGVIAGALALYLYCRFTRISGWKYADILTPGLCLGQAIGRWGNFFNSEAYGLPIPEDSTWPIREFIPAEARVVDPARGIDYSQFETYHPIFLYESLLNLVLVAILLLMFWKAPKLKAGTWVWTYVIGYSLIRIPYEILRVSAVAYLGNTSIKVAYVASAVGIVLGVAMLVYMYRFRFDPDLESIAHWLEQASGLESQVAETIVQRAWGIQKRNPQLDIAERVTLALPNLPSSFARSLPVTQRESLVRDLFLHLEGRSPEQTHASLASESQG